MVNVKVFADKQTEKQTNGQATQKLNAPYDLSMRGHKKCYTENEYYCVALN